MPNTYTNAKKDLTNTDVTTLYTAPALTTGIVKSILVSEDAGSGSTITLTITDAESSPATFSLYKTKTISSNATEELLTAPLVVKTGEILKVTAGHANRIHVTASILEVS